MNRSSKYYLPFRSLRRLPYESSEYEDFSFVGPFQTFVSSNGVIQLHLDRGIYVNLTVQNNSVRVWNKRQKVIISLSADGLSSAIIHPNGRIYQDHSRIETVAFDGKRTNNFIYYSKMWKHFMTFKTKNNRTAYIVDKNGYRQTTERFNDLARDCTLSVFYEDSHFGPLYVPEAGYVIRHAVYESTINGAHVIKIGGLCITQFSDGVVKVLTNDGKCLIRTNPRFSSTTVVVPFMYCTASIQHIFVRNRNQCIHYNGTSFQVRRNRCIAGFDQNNQPYHSIN